MTMKTRRPKTYGMEQKAVLRGKFIVIQSYLKKKATSQINNLKLNLKQLEKEEQKKPKVSRRKEIIKIRSEINEKGGFPGGAVVENLSANAGDMGSSPSLGRSHMPRSK